MIDVSCCSIQEGSEPSERKAGGIDDGRPIYIGRVVFPDSARVTAWTLQDEHGNQ